MNSKFDLKSILVGLLAGIVAMLAVGAGVKDHQIGRYQVSVGNGHGVMIDTVTGQGWQCYLGPDNVGGTDADFFKIKSPESK